MQASFNYGDEVWIPTKDGDPTVRALFDRHYSRQNDKARFVGPGERIVLKRPDCSAIFVWRREKFRLDGQTGVSCAVFRNEGDEQSSMLIREAVKLAFGRWGNVRLFTFVDADRVKSVNPGYCFIMAGWRRCGVSRKKLLILDFNDALDGTLYRQAIRQEPV